MCNVLQQMLVMAARESSLTFLCFLVIVMAMVEDESPGVTWIGPVQAPIETPTTVTVRLNL